MPLEKKDGYKIKLNKSQTAQISKLLRLSKNGLLNLPLKLLVEKSKSQNIFIWPCLDGVKVEGYVYGRRVATKVVFKEVFVEPSAKVIDTVNKAIAKAKSKEKLRGVIKLSSEAKELYNWRTKRNWVPMKVLDKLLHYTDYDGLLEDFLHGLRIRGGAGGEILTFNKNLTKDFARALGFLLTDGSIPVSNPNVLLCQKDIALAQRYAESLCDFFKLKKITYKSKDGVQISSAVLRYVLCRFYGMTAGYKLRTITVPNKILEAEPEVIKYFLAGIWDGDGSVSKYSNNNIEFVASSKNNGFILQLQRLLNELSIKSTTATSQGMGSIKIRRREDTLKFFIEVASKMLHKERKNKACKFFTERLILDKIRIDKTVEIVELLNKAIKKFGSRNKFALKLKEHGIKISNLRSIGNWNRLKHDSRPPIKAIMEVNKMLRKPLNNALKYPYNEFVRFYSNEA